MPFSVLCCFSLHILSVQISVVAFASQLLLIHIKRILCLCLVMILIFHSSNFQYVMLHISIRLLKPGCRWLFGTIQILPAVLDSSALISNMAYALYPRSLF